MAPPVDCEDFGAFDPTDDPSAGAWSAPLESPLNRSNLDTSLQETLPALSDSHHLPAESIPEAIFSEDDDWSSAEEYLPESANLNTSEAAYDLNHYDDPDTPIESINLSAEAEVVGGLSHLQALTDQVAQNIPETSNAGSAAPDARMNADFSAPHRGTDWSEPNNLLDIDPAEASFSEVLETPLPFYEPSSDISPPVLDYSTYEESVAEVPTPIHADDSSFYTEAVTEPGLPPTVKGQPSIPSVNPESVLTAAWIARVRTEPKQEYTPKGHLPTEPPESHAMAVKKANPEPVAQPPEPILIHHKHAQTKTQSAIKPKPIMPSQKNPTLLESLSPSQAINHFGRETILHEAQFVKQSINNLVDRYFSQQESDHS